MLYGVDLFSGIGGLTLGLGRWVRPLVYCEREPYSIGILLSRMATGELPRAPVWDDIRTLRGDMLPPGIGILYGGFPCQDISYAGSGGGLEGERSGLISEVWRLASELQPRFIFLENVPAILTRGLGDILRALAGLGYDARWLCLSASDVGACHLRNRWWLLAYRTGLGCGEGRPGGLDTGPTGEPEQPLQTTDAVRYNEGVRLWELHPQTTMQSGMPARFTNASEMGEATYSYGPGLEGRNGSGLYERTREGATRESGTQEEATYAEGPKLSGGISEARRFSERGISGGRHNLVERWPSSPPLCRGDDGLLYRVDRIKALGNAVVPACAEEAFRLLLYGLEYQGPGGLGSAAPPTE